MLCASAGNRNGVRWNRDPGLDCDCWFLLFCFIPFPSVLHGRSRVHKTVSYSSFRYSWVTPLAYFTLMSPALKSNTLCRWIYLYVANWQLISIRRRLTEAVHKTERALNRVLCKRGIYSHLIPRPFAFATCSMKICAYFVPQAMNVQGLGTRLEMQLIVRGMWWHHFHWEDCEGGAQHHYMQWLSMYMSRKRVTRVRACNCVKIETGRNFPPVLKIVTRTAQAA